MNFPIQRAIYLSAALSLVLPSCGVLGVKKTTQDKPEDHPFGEAQIPPQMLRRSANEGKPVAPLGGGSIFDQVAKPEDIVYTNPDDPDAEIPELASIFASQKSGPWEENERAAKIRSYREGKPLLIWFTDSQRSPMCKAISEELFSQHKFGDWANEKIIRLKVDSNLIGVGKDLDTVGDSEDLRARRRAYAAEMKKRYKVMGYPSIIVLSPSGALVGSSRGYKRGDGEFVWGKIKHAEAVSTAAYSSWRKGLENKGYREWRDRRDRRVFAKLTSYSNGTLTLIEPDGFRSKTKETNLSDADRNWIAEQKKMRNMQ